MHTFRMILRIRMGNTCYNFPHGIKVHLTNIFWNHVFSLKGLVLKFVICQTGWEQSWGPLGNKLVTPNHLISQQQDRSQASVCTRLLSRPRTRLCLTPGLALSNVLCFPTKSLPAARQAPAGLLPPWKLVLHPHTSINVVFVPVTTQDQRRAFANGNDNTKIKANLVLNLPKFGVLGFSACPMKQDSL